MKAQAIPRPEARRADDGIIGALYDGATSDASFARALALLAAHFDCRGAVLAIVDARQPLADLAIGHGAIDAASQALYRDFAHLDPAPAAFSAMAVGDVAATHRLFDERARAASRFYQEYYLPSGFEEALGGPIDAGEGRLAMVAVVRGRERPPFSDGDIAELRRFMPHAVRAMVLRRAFFALERRAVSLDAVVETLPVGTLILSGAGSLLHANAAARAVLDRRDGLALTRSGRVFAVEPQGRAFADALARAGAGQGPTNLRLPRPGFAAYGVRVARTEGEAGGVLVRVHDPDARQRDRTGGEALVATLLGVSPRCAELLVALAAGESPEAFAARVGISPNTAKFHLKAAFAATATHRRTDLVRQVNAILRDLDA